MSGSMPAIAVGNGMTTGLVAHHHHAGAEMVTILGTVTSAVINAAAPVRPRASVAMATIRIGAGVLAPTAEPHLMATDSTCLGVLVPIFLTCRSSFYKKCQGTLSAGSKEPSITKG